MESVRHCRLRVRGHVGMAIAVVACCLTLVLLWEVERWYYGSGWLWR